jgi:hypothetical protein
MRNGDRVAGLLEDVERGVVYVRVSQHDQRKLNIGEDHGGGEHGAGDAFQTSSVTMTMIAAGNETSVLARPE